MTASPFLLAHHWSNDALRRLDGLGLLPRGFDAGTETRSRLRAARLFLAARDSARLLHRPRVAALARAYLARFAEEFPTAVAEAAARDGSRPSTGIRVTSASLDGGYHERAGVLDVLAGRHTVPAPDSTSALGGGEVGIRLGSHLAGTLSATVDNGGAAIVAGYGEAVLGPVGIWAGRREIGFGAGRDGNIVLSPTAFTGGGLVLVQPWTGPGVLRSLGPIHFESFLSRMPAGPDYTFQRPLIWGNHLSLSPANGLTVGATRVFLMGGQGNQPGRVQYFLRMLVGAYNHWHSETASVDVRWRTPLHVFPLVAYMEWGMETASGAFLNEPGETISLSVPAIPGAPWLGLAVERTGFHGRVVGTAPWYVSQIGMWTDRGQPMGHPLGGHGHEYALHISADPAGARVRVSMLGFVRDRGAINLYRDSRQGVSRGGWIRAGWRFTDHLDLDAYGYYERGSGWTETKLDASLRWLVPLSPGR